MFDFLRALRKTGPDDFDDKPSKKSAFAIKRCITVKKCESSKKVVCDIEIQYDHKQSAWGSMSGRSFAYGTSASFEASSELKIYIERLKLLQAKLEDAHCAMKLEEENN